MKYKKKWLYTIYFCFIIVSATYSQYGQWSNMRIYTLKSPIYDSTYSLDSLSIVPNSLVVFQNGIWISNPPLILYWEKSKVKWLGMASDSIILKYRVWPENYSKPKDLSPFLLSESNIAKELPMFQNLGKRMTLSENKNTLDMDGMEYSGSLYRGITIGNNQDVALHSGLNLNLRGQLSNGIEILSSISDANIPLQPEGNSASIQEFDRIFIQLKKNNHKLILGDFDIKEIASSYFLKVNRKLQGINFQSSHSFDSSKFLTYGATAGVTRGNFSRNIFTAKENQQGPYRLIGNNGETFIIIIAGTEKVFINGQEMRRGLDLDYTINYNTGEIYFTTKRLITQDLRIVVEFQYSDRNYFRYTLESNAKYENKHTKIYSQIFLETDDKNQALNMQFSNDQIELLKKIGNDENQAIVPSYKKTDWDATRILYRKKDTLINNVEYLNILEYSTTTNDSVYSATFTFLGTGMGNYRLKATNANGPVYEWVAPIEGIKQGGFEPLIKVATPKTHFQAIAGIETNLKNGLELKNEFSYTNHDLNTYSDIDNSKNKGIGNLFNSSYLYNIDSSKTLKIVASHEFTSNSFSPITRYRNLEFNRDWDINTQSRNFKTQNQLNAKIEYISKSVLLYSQFTGFWIDNIYHGIQYKIGSEIKTNRWETKSSLDYLIANPRDSVSTFFRPQFLLSYQLDSLKNWTIGAGLSHEIKIKKLTNTNLWQNNSFEWQNYSLFLSNSEKKQNHTVFEYIFRTESYLNKIAENQFDVPAIKSHTFKLNGTWNKNPQNIIKYSLTYRNFFSKFDTLLSELNHNYMGRIEYNRQLMRGFFKSISVYEIKAGREQKMQITYIKAPNGYGNYAWNDLNSNGIFELEEAYQSSFTLENRYVRFFSLLPEFIPAHQLAYSQNIWINPKAIWFNQKDFRKTLSKFSYNIRLDIERKQLTNRETVFVDFLNPFLDLRASNILTSKTSLFQQLSFQKNEEKTEIELEHFYTYLKSLMTNGTDGQLTRNYTLKLRQNFSSVFSTKIKLINGYRQNSSEYFLERNFSFVHNEFEVQFISDISSKFRSIIGGIYWFKSNGNIYSINKQADFEIVYNHSKTGQIEAKASLLQLDYLQTNANPQIQLAMLQGLNPGNNLILNIMTTQKISKVFELNIFYNGRYNNSQSRWVHNANMEVRAMF